MLKIESVSFSKKLQEKSHNGDHVLIHQQINNITIALLADGLGSYVGDWKASEIAVNEFIKEFTESFKSDNLQDSIEKSITYINKLLLDETGFFKGMKTTFIVLVIDLENERYAYVSIGDSRLYLIKNNHLQQLSIDQTKAVVRRKQDGTPFESGGAIVQASGVTHVIGIPELTFKVFEQPLPENATFILASDGFYNNMVQIENTFTKIAVTMKLESEVGKIFQKVLESQNDDTSVVVVRILNEFSNLDFEKSLSSPPETENLLALLHHLDLWLNTSINNKESENCYRIIHYIEIHRLQLSFKTYDSAVKLMFKLKWNQSELYQKLIELMRKSR
jgi:PPM family protein phosphatase